MRRDYRCIESFLEPECAQFSRGPPSHSGRACQLAMPFGAVIIGKPYSSLGLIRCRWTNSWVQTGDPYASRPFQPQLISDHSRRRVRSLTGQ